LGGRAYLGTIVFRVELQPPQVRDRRTHFVGGEKSLALVSGRGRKGGREKGKEGGREEGREGRRGTSETRKSGENTLTRCGHRPEEGGVERKEGRREGGKKGGRAGGYR
jgi:hypothetical protein